MGNIIFCAIELLLLGTGIFFTSFFLLASATTLTLIQITFFSPKKVFTYYLFPLLFFISCYLNINFKQLNKGDNITVVTNLVDGRGKITKLDGKYPLHKIYLQTRGVSDGEYILNGKVLKLSKNKMFLKFKTENQQRCKPNIIKIFFNAQLERIGKYLEPETKNLLRGTVLGEKRYISKDIRDSFIQTGAGHLLAISGLHTGIIVGLIYFLINLLKLNRNMKYILTLSFLTLYVFGINTGPSVIRAYIMIASFLVAKILYTHADIKKSLAIALIMSLILQPNSCGDISFIYSYMCLFSIIYIFPKYEIKKKRKHRDILNLLILTGVIQIFIAPISLYFFGTIPFFSYFSNFFITLFGSIFTALGGLGLFMPSIIFWLLFAPSLEGIYTVLLFLFETFEKIPLLAIESQNKPTLGFIILIN